MRIIFKPFYWVAYIYYEIKATGALEDYQTARAYEEDKGIIEMLGQEVDYLYNKRDYYIDKL